MAQRRRNFSKIFFQSAAAEAKKPSDNQLSVEDKAKTLPPEYKLILDGGPNSGVTQLPTQTYELPGFSVDQNNITSLDPSSFEKADEEFTGSGTTTLTATWQRNDDRSASVQIPREDGSTRETVWRDTDGFHISTDQTDIYNLMPVHAERRFDTNGVLAERTVTTTITTSRGWNGLMELLKGWDGVSEFSDGWNGNTSLRETYKDGRLKTSVFHSFGKTDNLTPKTHDLVTTIITVDKDEGFDQNRVLLSSHRKAETITTTNESTQVIKLEGRDVTRNKAEGTYLIQDYSSTTRDGKETYASRSTFTASDSEGDNIINGNRTVTYDGKTTSTPMSPTPLQNIAPTPPPKTKDPAAASL